MQLIEQLQTAIFKFAKRQQTWFNKLEKEGIIIKWVGKNYDLQNLLSIIKQVY